MWKIVPVITKAGYNLNSRCGESILNNAEMRNLVATSNEDYFEKAVYFAKNIDKLEDVRKKIFNRILRTPLFDTKEFSKDFCQALDNMQNSIIKNYK